jgi:hypothetical protein
MMIDPVAMALEFKLNSGSGGRINKQELCSVIIEAASANFPINFAARINSAFSSYRCRLNNAHKKQGRRHA